MDTLIVEDLQTARRLGNEEIADAYSKAVPPRMVAAYIKCDETNTGAIEKEREDFRRFILTGLNEYPDLYHSQRDAWDVYTWDWDEWEGRGDYELEPGESPDALVWESYLYSALMEQMNPSNVDRETGGQQ